VSTPTRACYFDLDGTLLEYDAPFADLLTETFAAVGVDDPDRSLLETYSDAFFAVIGVADDPFAAAVSRTDAPVDPEAFSTAQVRTEADHVVAVDGAESVLDALDGCRLGVLTNGFGPAQRAKLDAVGLRDRFEAVVVSGEVGVRKPEAGIYRVAAERLVADDYAFVADDLERDVLPAVDRGWRGVYVGPESATGSDATAVRTLREVSDALAGW
jgi:HAD superfamily hydrolase (TIGR01549 family)